MKNFTNQVVVITGAGSGIGRALALNFAKLGARLALNDIDKNSLKFTVDLLPKTTPVMEACFDVSDQTKMNKFASDVINKFGKVNIVINNAGIGINKFRADKVSIADYKTIFNTNLWGTIYGSIAFLPYLRKQSQSNLVNISSVFGLTGVPGQAPYSSSKFAVKGFTESLQLEEKIHNTGVVVSIAYPGGIKTNIAKTSIGAVQNPATITKFEKNYTTSADKAAKIIIKGISRDKQKIFVSGYAHAFNLTLKVSNRLINKYLKMGYERL